MRKLKQFAQDDRDHFDAWDGECTCHYGIPPCGWCTHPGNPRNQEDEDCWESINVEVQPRIDGRYDLVAEDLEGTYYDRKAVEFGDLAAEFAGLMAEIKLRS